MEELLKEAGLWVAANAGQIEKAVMGSGSLLLLAIGIVAALRESWKLDEAHDKSRSVAQEAGEKLLY